MDYVLAANSLAKAYGTVKALDAVSMPVPKGAIYGFIGKNTDKEIDLEAQPGTADYHISFQPYTR